MFVEITIFKFLSTVCLFVCFLGVSVCLIVNECMSMCVCMSVCVSICVYLCLSYSCFLLDLGLTLAREFQHQQKRLTTNTRRSLSNATPEAAFHTQHQQKHFIISHTTPPEDCYNAKPSPTDEC